MSQKPLKQTPLYQQCLQEGGRMANFAGWEMPIQFSGLINEHKSVRNNAGMFDVSHMGVFLLKGKNPKDSLQKLVPTDLFRIGPGEACYTVLTNSEGGILDDLIIYDLGSKIEEEEESLLIIINAANTDSDIAWIKQNIDLKEISISDTKKDGILIALQGPQSINILQKLTDETLSNIPKFGHKFITLDPKKFQGAKQVFIGRTGYTGEDGFELLTTKSTGQTLWRELLESGVSPCGLGARDTLRLEAAMHLYGNDLNTMTTPLEAGLGWLVNLEMPKEFFGRETLEKQTKEGIQKRLVGLMLNEKAIARKGYRLIHKGEIVGKITSGTWSPTLQKGIAMGYLPSELSFIGSLINIEIRGKEYQATVVKRPFYRRVS